MPQRLDSTTYSNSPISSTPKQGSRLLINEPPLLVLPTMAVKIGLNRAIFLQQVQFWINNPKSGREIKGRKWIYDTQEEWQKQLPFWSLVTIRRLIAGLVKDGLLLKGNFNKMGRDRTAWYTINYDKLNSLLEDPDERKKDKRGSKQRTRKMSEISRKNRAERKAQKAHFPSAQVEQMQVLKLSRPLPETSTENSETNPNSKKRIRVIGDSNESSPETEQVTLSSESGISDGKYGARLPSPEADALVDAVHIFLLGGEGYLRESAALIAFGAKDQSYTNSVLGIVRYERQCTGDYVDFIELAVDVERFADWHANIAYPNSHGLRSAETWLERWQEWRELGSP